MSKIVITADVHFGIHGRLDDILWSFRNIELYSINNNIEYIIILGDLFHDRTALNIEVLNKVYLFFKESKKKGLQWIIFPGNHDMVLRNSWGINSLKSLEGLVTIIEDVKLIKLLGRRFWIVPFIFQEQVYMNTIEKIEQQHEENDVLLTHVGVCSAILNECFMIKNWSIVNFEESLFDFVFTGHFHCYQNVTGKNNRGNVWYPGSPIAFNYSEGATEHGFIEFDTTNNNVKFIDLFELNLTKEKMPPKFIMALDEDINKIQNVANNNIRITLSKDYSNDQLLRIKNELIEKGASEIKWHFLKENDNLKSTKKLTDESLDKFDNLFKKWIEHDKPENLDSGLLLKLNETLISKAETLQNQDNVED